MLNYDNWKGRILRALWRYGLAVFSVMAALTITIPLKQYTDITPLFYAAIVLSAWFGGMGPGLIAVLLSAVAIDYYFVEPLYTLGLETKRTSFLLVFGLLAILTSWMSTNRKRAQQALQQARNELELRVQERTAELRQANETLRERANLLDLTHDTVFVRDMNDVITFWNRGAEERYGWKRREAVGQNSHR